MAQNSENIEAKLAAYIDDELDADGRAEIEQYLRSNPHHRRLLGELGRTHGLLAELPRESAPPEIAEEFNSQLERSALLHKIGAGDAAVGHRLNRRPQILALAAIVMLTVGLGAVLYFVLLPATQAPLYTTAGDRPRAAAAPTTAPGAHGAVTEAETFGGAASAARDARDEPAAPSVPGADKPARQARALEAERLLVLERRLADAPGLEPSHTLVMVVRTDNVAATRDQVLSFLSVNGIEFQPVAASSESAIPPATQANVAPPQNNYQALGNADSQVQQQQPPAPRMSDAPDESLILARQMTRIQADTFARALPRWRDGQQVEVYHYEAAPATAPIDAVGPADAQRLVQATQPVEVARPRQAPATLSPQPPNEANEATEAPSATRPVADAVPPIAPGEAPTTQPIAPSVAESAKNTDEPPATRPAPLVAGDWLSVSVEPADGTGARVYVVRVGDDGAINLPELGLLPVLELTIEQLGERLTVAYRESGMVLARAIQVRRTQAPARDADADAEAQAPAPPRVDMLIYVAAETAMADAPATDAAPVESAPSLVPRTQPTASPDGH